MFAHEVPQSYDGAEILSGEGELYFDERSPSPRPPSPEERVKHLPLNGEARRHHHAECHAS